MIRALVLFLTATGFLSLGYFYGGILPIYGMAGYVPFSVAAVFSVLLIRRIKIPPSQTCVVFGLVFGGFLMARAMLSPVPFLAWRDLFSIEASLIVYVLLAFQLTETKQRLWLLGALCILMLASTIVGVIQFSRDNNFMLQGTVRPDYGVRASGFFICPNHFSGFCEMVTLLAFSVALWGRMGYVPKILLVYCGCVGLTGIVLSGSRGGYLSLAAGGATMIGLSFWFIVRDQKEKLFRFLLVVGILVAIAGAGVIWIFSRSTELKDRAEKIADTQNVRTLLWGAALQQAKTSPLFGTGAGTYTYYGRKFRDPSVQHDPVRVHGDYLELFAEYGLVGLGLFGICLAAHGWNGVRSVRWLVNNRLMLSSRGQSSALAFQVGALSGIVALLVHSVVDFNMHIPVNAALAAALMGILASPGVEMGVRISRREPVYFLAQIFAALLGAFLLFQLLPNARKEYHGEMARIALGRGDLGLALAEARKGMGRGNATTAYILGEARRQIAMQSGIPAVRNSFLESAVEAYKLSLNNSPHDSFTMVRLAQCLDLLGKFDQAEEIYADLGRWDPKLSRYHAMLGLHYQLQGKKEEARREYEEAKRLRPSPYIQRSLDSLNAPSPAVLKQE